MSVEEKQIASKLITPADVMGMLPSGLRYRFLDEIQEIDEAHVIASYLFRKDEFFYPGHFPERAITPGTILLEAMCQCGIAAQSYYLLAQEMPIAVAREYRILFTGAEVEWFKPTGPGVTITIQSELIAWRRRRIRARVQVFDERNTSVAESRVAGMCVLLGGPVTEHRIGAKGEQFEPMHDNNGGGQHEPR